MTCIVGLIDNNEKKIYMGADSGASNSQLITTVADKKIFKRINKKNQEFLFGYSSSFRMGQLLQYIIDLPEYDENDDIMDYMVSNFVEEIRRIFKERGYSKIDNNEEVGGNFLIGFHGNLFEMEEDFHISRLIYNYSSIGSGYLYAYGSLYTTENFSITSFDRVKLALEAAGNFNPFVKPPYSYDFIYF